MVKDDVSTVMRREESKKPLDFTVIYRSQDLIFFFFFNLLSSSLFRFSRGFNKFIGYFSDVPLPSGCRNFGKNVGDHNEWHKHFAHRSCLCVGCNLFFKLISLIILTSFALGPR